MKKSVALLMKEKRPGINGKMVTPTFFELHTVYMTIFFHTLLAIHRSVASYKYFKNLISEVSKHWS